MVFLETPGGWPFRANAKKSPQNSRRSGQRAPDAWANVSLDPTIFIQKDQKNNQGEVDRESQRIHVYNLLYDNLLFLASCSYLSNFNTRTPHQSRLRLPSAAKHILSRADHQDWSWQALQQQDDLRRKATQSDEDDGASRLPQPESFSGWA